MVNDDGQAGTPGKTLETPNPDGEIIKESPECSNLAGSGDTRIENDMVNGSRVSDDLKPGESVEPDGGKAATQLTINVGITLGELRRKSSYELNHGADEASNMENKGQIDAEVVDNSDSSLRRSKRHRCSDESKNLKTDEDEERENEGKKKEDDEDVDNSDDEDEESEFSVGDFVWGKVKSHPWWPGRVFDPSEASEQALKYKHEGRILVAYFGDATFAWCDSSQLKPFVENFAEMSRQSSSKSFVNAVEEAVSEFARLVELDMTCYCTSRNNQNSHQQFSVNAGIKGGVNVDKGGLGMYSVDCFDPETFLADLRLVGKHVSVGDKLQLNALKSRVFSVYRPKDQSLILTYNELQKDAGKEGDGSGIKDPIPIMPDGLAASKRKERSVAEILYGNDKGNEDNGNTESKSRKNKRKVANEEKKTGDGEAPKRKTDHGDEAEEENKTGKSSSRKKVKATPRPIVIENAAVALEESEMSPRTRERKRSRYLSPPYTNIEYFRQTAVSSPRALEAKAVESSNVSQKGETSTNSAALVSCSVEASKRKVSNGSAPRTPRSSSRKVPIASSDNVLSEIRSAAVSGKASKEDDVKGFLSSYRSSRYQFGRLPEGSEAADQSKKNGKSEKSEKLSKEPRSEEIPRKESEKPKSKNKVTLKGSSAALHLKFPRNHPLPSEDDLTAVYGTFGALERSKMKISQEKSSAKVVFIKISDAEAAMKSSKASNPFGTAEVRYRVRHLKAIAEDKDVAENGEGKKKGSDSRKKRGRSSEKQADGGLKLVKKKLEEMATMVAEAGNGKMSKEMKVSLEGGLKDLLKEVKALPALPSTGE